MKHVCVLGCGLVGAPMAHDLATPHGSGEAFHVTVADVRAEPLERLKRSSNGAITTRVMDVSDPNALADLVSSSDVVLSAVPGHLGFRTLETLMGLGKRVVDIAFCQENPLGLDELAKARGGVAVVDMGVGPGLSSVLIGSCVAKFAETSSIMTYVGGLPTVRRWPYEYRAVFSPIDVIEEYTRPARYIEQGKLVVRPALSDPELLHFPSIGTLEAFNTDGLRTMAETLKVPNMKEKTLRYPGHIEKIAVLRETGFFSTTPVDVGTSSVRPIDVTAKLLFPMWTMPADEADITVMKIIVEGADGRGPCRTTFDLFDRFDPETGIHSMARTTGYTATAAVRMMASGLIADRGVIAPELLGFRPDCVEFLVSQLASRNVRFTRTDERLSSEPAASVC